CTRLESSRWLATPGCNYPGRCPRLPENPQVAGRYSQQLASSLSRARQKLACLQLLTYAANALLFAHPYSIKPPWTSSEAGFLPPLSPFTRCQYSRTYENLSLQLGCGSWWLAEIRHGLARRGQRAPLNHLLQ